MPQEVMDNIIGILPKNEKTIVVDCFMGSGTTAIACKKQEVDFIGMEMDETYFEIASNRVQEAEKQITLF